MVFFRGSFKLAVLLVAAVTVTVCNAAEDNGNNDTLALTLFRLNADVHGILASNWTTSDACSGEWVGVRCGGAIGTRVTSLTLPSIDLRGPLDPLVTLSELRSLDLHSNRLNGTLHGVASSFPNLKLLYLSRNDLSGEIPPLLLGSSRRLRRLDLSSNNLRGSIPASVGNLTGLLTLRLQNNLLSGAIPNDDTDLLLRLVDFDVSNNELVGVVPQSLRDKFGDDPFAGNADLCGMSPPFSFALHSCSAGNNDSASSPSPSPTTSKTTVVTSSVVPSNPSSFPDTSSVSSSEAHGENRKGNGKGRLSVGVIIGIAIANATVILLLMSSLFYVYFCYFSSASSFRRTVADDEDDEEGAVEKSVRGGSGTEDEEKQKVKYYYNGFYHKQNSGRRDQEGSSTIASATVPRGGTAVKNNDKLVFFDEDSSGLHVQRFDLDDLLRSSAEMVGRGSLGTVYRAVLEDGWMVAVKRLRDSNPCDRADFESYMDLIARLSNRHPNLVALRAYYYATQEKLLIYDYIPNSTLHAVIHSGRECRSDESESDWSVRVGLALGTARGLARIHNHQEDIDDEEEENRMSNRPLIPHGNVTSSNVLIDGNGNARLSDFGLALLLDPANATAKLGGYRAPEQIVTKTLSQQADVYAFGIILLELLTGKDPSSQQLPEWVKSGLREEEGFSEVFDASLLLLQHKNVRQEMLAMVDVALACVSNDPEHRPIMTEVVNMITSIIRRHEMESEDDPPISSSPSIVGNDDEH